MPRQAVSAQRGAGCNPPLSRRCVLGGAPRILGDILGILGEGALSHLHCLPGPATPVSFNQTCGPPAGASGLRTGPSSGAKEPWDRPRLRVPKHPSRSHCPTTALAATHQAGGDRRKTSSPTLVTAGPRPAPRRRAPRNPLRTTSRQEQGGGGSGGLRDRDEGHVEGELRGRG